jgi:hypothetical protein
MLMSGRVLPSDVSGRVTAAEDMTLMLKLMLMSMIRRIVSSPERWEIKQLISSGVVSAADVDYKLRLESIFRKVADMFC